MPGPRGPRQLGQKFSKDALKNVGAIFRVMWDHYKGLFCLVIVGILVSAWAMLQSTLFMQSLIDEYITPMLAQRDAGATTLDYRPLALAIGRLGMRFDLSRFDTGLFHGIKSSLIASV